MYYAIKIFNSGLLFHLFKLYLSHFLVWLLVRTNQPAKEQLVGYEWKAWLFLSLTKLVYVCPCVVLNPNLSLCLNKPETLWTILFDNRFLNSNDIDTTRIKVLCVYFILGINTKNTLVLWISCHISPELTLMSDK